MRAHPIGHELARQLDDLERRRESLVEIHRARPGFNQPSKVRAPQGHGAAPYANRRPRSPRSSGDLARSSAARTTLTADLCTDCAPLSHWRAPCRKIVMFARRKPTIRGAEVLRWPAAADRLDFLAPLPRGRRFAPEPDGRFGSKACGRIKLMNFCEVKLNRLDIEKTSELRQML